MAVKMPTINTALMREKKRKNNWRSSPVVIYAYLWYNVTWPRIKLALGVVVNQQPKIGDSVYSVLNKAAPTRPHGRRGSKVEICVSDAKNVRQSPAVLDVSNAWPKSELILTDTVPGPKTLIESRPINATITKSSVTRPTKRMVANASVAARKNLYFLPLIILMESFEKGKR